MIRNRTVRLLLVLFLLGGIAAAGLLGWQWQASLRCKRIAVSGMRHADPDTLLALSGVDTSMLLFSIDPALVEDRVERHPWVRAAHATRLPTGTLALRVEERRPVVLVVGAGGTPCYYLDPEGFPLPLLPGAVYNVPLLRGLTKPYHPMRRVTEKNVPELLAALAAAGDEEDALLSELEIRSTGEVWLYTSPTGQGHVLPVRLGHGPFAHKLALLCAFWYQAVLPQPNKAFTLIDLRFDSQVVTREAVGD